MKKNFFFRYLMHANHYYYTGEHEKTFNKIARFMPETVIKRKRTG